MSVGDLKLKIASGILTPPILDQKPSTSKSSGMSPHSVVDTHSEKISVYDYDVLADELAEIVSKHTFNLVGEDDSKDNTTVAMFRTMT